MMQECKVIIKSERLLLTGEETVQNLMTTLTIGPQWLFWGVKVAVEAWFDRRFRAHRVKGKILAKQSPCCGILVRIDYTL